MTIKKYTYSFPENKELKEQLGAKDILLVADRTGYKIRTVYAMLNGERKLNEAVETECIRLAEINNKK